MAAFSPTPNPYDDRQAELRRIEKEAMEKWLDEQAKLPPIKPVEPCRPNPPLTTPAKPGNHFAQAAWKAGCDDEYQNAMDAKYGPGY
jgi:hypothetical protein